MKKILFLLLLNISVYAQISTGQETKFPYGIKNTGSQFIATPDTLVTKGTDGTYGHTSSYRLPISNDTFEALELKSNYSSTSVRTGCVISEGSGAGLFSVSAGTFMIADNSTGSPVLTPVTFAGATDVAAIYPRTILYITSAGTLIQFNGATGDLSPTQRRQNLFLGGFAFDGVNVLAIQNTPNIDYDISQRFNDLTQALGVRNVEGNVLTANGANLMINKTSGRTFRHMSNYQIDKNVPDVTTDNAAIPIPSGINLLAYRNGLGGWTYESYSGSLTPTFWDNGTGVKATVANNKFTIPRVNFFNGTDTYIFYLGQKEYGTIDAAIADADRSDRVIDPATSLSSYRGGVVVEKSVTDLQAGIIANTVRFIPPPGGAGAAGGGTVSTQNLQGVYNNSVNPEITTDATRGAFTVRNGQVSDTSNVLEGQNIAGSTTFGVAGNGNVTGGTYNGYIPENIANKSDSFTVSSSTTYASTKGLVDGLATKQNTLTNPVTGTGTANFVPKWTGTNTQGNSSFTDNGSISQSGVPFTSVRGSGANYGLRTSGTSLSATSYGFYNVTTIGSANTSFHYGYSSELSTQATAFSISNVSHFRVQNVGLGAGSSVINQYGYNMSDLTSGTNNYGYYGDVSLGVAKWNLYMNGTAKNYLNGSLLLGSSIDTGEKLQVTGDSKFTGNTIITNAPTTSAGTYDILTRNTSTGVVEKVASGGAFVTLTGNQTVAGIKTFSNTLADASRIVVNTGTDATAQGFYALTSSATQPAALIAASAANSTGLRVSTVSTGTALSLTSNTVGSGSTSTLLSIDNKLTGNEMKPISVKKVGVEVYNVGHDGTMLLGVFTVATLPTPTTTAYATVTDATAPTYLGTLTGGGSVVCPVFYNGSAWVSH